MIAPETLTWLRHAASCGRADAQLTLHILERLEALEKKTAFRDLCAELVEQLQRAINDYGFSLEGESALMFRARKELAQPEREGLSLAEVDELAAPTPEAAPMARLDGDWFAVALVAQDMRSRGLAEQIAGDELLKLAHAQPPAAQPLAAQPTPPAAPYGGLVERVEARAGGDGRAAIREVSAWAGQMGLLRTERKLREEADR